MTTPAVLTAQDAIKRIEKCLARLFFVMALWLLALSSVESNLGRRAQLEHLQAWLALHASLSGDVSGLTPDGKALARESEEGTRFDPIQATVRWPEQNQVTLSLEAVALKTKPAKDSDPKFEVWRFGPLGIRLPVESYALLVKDDVGRIVPWTSIQSAVELSAASAKLEVAYATKSHPIGWSHILRPGEDPPWELETVQGALDVHPMEFSFLGLKAGVEVFFAGIGVLLGALSVGLLGPLSVLSKERIDGPLCTSWMPAMPIRSGVQDRLLFMGGAVFALLPLVTVGIAAFTNLSLSVTGVWLGRAGIAGGLLCSFLVARAEITLRNLRVNQGDLPTD